MPKIDMVIGNVPSNLYDLFIKKILHMSSKHISLIAFKDEMLNSWVKFIRTGHELNKE